jgi:hypothetical protein
MLPGDNITNCTGWWSGSWEVPPYSYCQPATAADCSINSEVRCSDTTTYKSVVHNHHCPYIENCNSDPSTNAGSECCQRINSYHNSGPYHNQKQQYHPDNNIEDGKYA